MSVRVTITGGIAEPKQRTTPQGKQLLELSIAGTHSVRDKQTGTWSEVGEPLWIRAAFWEQDAERLANALSKGDRVTVEGTLIRRTWENQKTGSQGESLELQFPRFLGVIPKRPQNGYQNAPGQAYTSGGYQTPAHDPWAAQNATQDQYGEAPF